VPKNYGESVSLIGAIDHSGLIANFAVQGASDIQAMLVFLNRNLIARS
jgi:hypothetical protein